MVGCVCVIFLHGPAHLRTEVLYTDSVAVVNIAVVHTAAVDTTKKTDLQSCVRLLDIPLGLNRMELRALDHSILPAQLLVLPAAATVTFLP